MAYPCKIWLKNEFDGCGMCEDRNALGIVSRGRPCIFCDNDESEVNPFEVDMMDLNKE